MSESAPDTPADVGCVESADSTCAPFLCRARDALELAQGSAPSRTFDCEARQPAAAPAEFTTCLAVACGSRRNASGVGKASGRCARRARAAGSCALTQRARLGTDLPHGGVDRCCDFERAPSGSAAVVVISTHDTAGEVFSHAQARRARRAASRGAVAAVGGDDREALGRTAGHNTAALPVGARYVDADLWIAGHWLHVAVVSTTSDDEDGHDCGSGQRGAQ